MLLKKMCFTVIAATVFMLLYVWYYQKFLKRAEEIRIDYNRQWENWHHIAVFARNNFYFSNPSRHDISPSPSYQSISESSSALIIWKEGRIEYCIHFRKGWRAFCFNTIENTKESGKKEHKELCSQSYSGALTQSYHLLHTKLLLSSRETALLTKLTTATTTKNNITSMRTERAHTVLQKSIPCLFSLPN